jgi:hypothetical protein
MSDYFILRSAPSIEDDDVKGYMEIEEWDDIEGFEDWGVGRPGKSRPAGKVEIRARRYDGYKGEPDDFSDDNVPLMSKRLKEAIESAGVDNITFHPVTVRTKKETWEYYAFNLVGLISAVDPASEVQSPDGDFLGDSSITDLVIDDSKCRGLLMFRLKEKFSIILVHRKLKEAIERSGISSVKFLAPEDFMAL